MELQSFKVTKLHGTMPDYQIKFQDNTLILIGENGSGKTTLMKMLFYTLSAQWFKLISSYEFENIELKMKDISTPIKIKREELVKKMKIDNSRVRIPFFIQQELNSGKLNIQQIKELCNRYEVSYESIINEIDISIYSKNTFKDYLKDIHILYLPTYRRIEHDLKDVLGDRLDNNRFRRPNLSQIKHSNNYTELVEFGMYDVIDSVGNRENKLYRDFSDSLNALSLNYLREVMNGEYKNANNSNLKKIADETIKNVVNRVNESILSGKDKTNLIDKILELKNRNNILDHSQQVVCHYFEKLYKIYQESEKRETSIQSFAKVCSKYFKNKKVEWNSAEFSLKITPEYSDEAIQFSQLSSGEKQIAGLFSKILLGNSEEGDNKKYFIIIDEPELSLSVKWQKEFLQDIHDSQYCEGLFAVTHSPFIFDNSLDKYAHGLDEFIVLR